MSDTGLLLIVALISVAIGYFAGLMLTSMAKDKEADKKAAEEAVEGEDSSQQMKPQYVLTRLDVTLWSKTPNGPLLANSLGKTLTSPSVLSDADRRQLEFQLNAVQSWMGVGMKKAAVSASQPVASEKQAESAPAAAATAETRKPASESPEGSSEGTPPGVEARPLVQNLTLADQPGRIDDLPPSLTQMPVTPVPARVDLKVFGPNLPKQSPKSFVEQIDEIVQGLIAGTPSEKLSIRLLPSPTHGVDVWIGQDCFPGMDQIPEGDAKQIIKAAIARWENR